MTAVLPADECTDAARPARLLPTRHVVRLYDQTELVYRAWMPAGAVRQGLLLIHRGHEHSGRFDDVVPHLAAPGTAIFAWDARGHGETPGPRGYAPSFAHVVRDLDFWARHVAATHQIPLENMVVLGHSIGAVTVATWVHDYAPPLRAIVLVAPAFRVKLYVPAAIPGLRFLQKIRGSKPTYIKSYVKAKMLTHDAAQAAAYDADDKIARSIAVNMLLDLHDTATRIVADAGTIRMPALLLNAGSDWVVKPAAAADFFARLASPVKRLRTLPGMYHDLLHEQGREEVLGEIRGFVAEARAREPVRYDATPDAATLAEHEQLQRPLPWWSLRRANFALQRGVMKTLGRLSDGMRLGWRAGFNSGHMLDYVYENRPRGSILLGRVLDKTYLNAIGWRGIRLRKTHIQELLRHAAGQLAERGQAVRIVDVAAGRGRYLLEMDPPISGAEILLRDADAGLWGADERMPPGVRFECADAFDEAGLAGLTPAPTVAIVSGLFELVPENDRVMRTLRGLAAALQSSGGGYLIYTGQPWHPQLEMIARVLVGPDGEPWAMRRRSQRELDALVSAAGFRKIEQRIDPFGIFTVSLAEIPAAPDGRTVPRE